MASSFPGAIDNFTDPLANSSLASPSHAGQHSDLNDAVEKIETYMGLVKVIPTSVSSSGGTGATLSANGTVNVGTSNSTVSVVGAFSALYDNYEIVFTDISVSSQCNITFQFEDGAGSAISSGYSVAGFYQLASGTLNGNWNVNGASYIECLPATTTSTSSGRIFLQAPYLAKYKRHQALGMSAAVSFCYFGLQQFATSYTRFRIGTSSGTMTGGTIRVYGYRN